jgi:two-component system sensor histidine kinase KdpD
MTDEAARPDPDELLGVVRDGERRARKGRLKIFFGMCPGVGKTFAMLRAAHQERAAGVYVLAGLVETHGRRETEELLVDLPVQPRRLVQHHGTTLTELDVEGILAAKPKLALVDELAHTNATGSRHAKRWQDVIELLDAGIDVFTTLNIQHVESRADSVRQITGAPVHETVPDSIIDLADELELVDLTPERLLERLRTGKVYLGERAEAALNNFFQESKLSALREIALRYTAERVDRELRDLRAGQVRRVVWRSGERLLVAVGPSPFSTQLVRWTRRLAAAQGAPWIALHVETSHGLAPDEQLRLDKNLALARELGAEIVVTHDDDVPAALVRIALRQNATQIVIGKPRSNRWLDVWRGGTMVDRLVRLGGNIDIYVVPAEPSAPARRPLILDPVLRSPPREYGLVAGTLVALTVLGKLLPSDTYQAWGLVYLLAVLVLSLRVGRWPLLLAGVASALAWNFLFMPPHFTFVIGHAEDTILFFTYFVVAVVAGQLTARIRAQGAHERTREERATALFHLTRRLAEADTLDAAVFAALRQIDSTFGVRSTLLIAVEAESPPSPHFAASFQLDARERGVAEWAFLHGRPAGRFTATLPSVVGWYTPLLREGRAVGVLGIAADRDRHLSLSERDLLDAFARQLALVVERDRLQAASAREKLLAESEKLHRTLLDSVSHELRTPLAVISGSVETLHEAGPEMRATLVGEIRTAARRLNRLVGNLLDQTRLETGALEPRMDWCDPGDIVNAALDDVRDSLEGHPVELSLPDDLPPIQTDFALTEQALANLLLNASVHTPAATPISVAVGLERGGDRMFFTVSDRGPGLPPALKERPFEKFARGNAARAGGLGLGLSIVRGFITAQGGEVVARENPSGGAVFTIYLSHRAGEAPSNPE